VAPGVPDVLLGEPVVRVDGVEDLDAALEIDLGLGSPDHPDRFSFPCLLA
jgi:hypothetical protein